MAISIGGLIHRVIVYGSIGWGIYGTVVITQNLMVKRNKILEAQKQDKQAVDQAAADLQTTLPITISSDL